MIKMLSLFYNTRTENAVHSAHIEYGYKDDTTWKTIREKKYFA